MSAQGLPYHLTKRSPQDDTASEGGDHNEHLFHGQHLWGLEEFHEGGDAEARSKRSPQDEEASEGGDHNEHLFHGQHLWGLEEFHETAEEGENS